jgi:hypothetical protein
MPYFIYRLLFWYNQITVFIKGTFFKKVTYFVSGIEKVAVSNMRILYKSSITTQHFRNV